MSQSAGMVKKLEELQSMIGDGQATVSMIHKANLECTSAKDTIAILESSSQPDAKEILTKLQSCLEKINESINGFQSDLDHFHKHLQDLWLNQSVLKLDLNPRARECFRNVAVHGPSA